MPIVTPITWDGETTQISAGKMVVAVKIRIKSHRGLTEIQITIINPRTSLTSKSLNFKVPVVVRNLKIDETLQRHNLELRNQKASIQTIENQVGQIAQLLSARPQGSLPSNTEINPNAEAKAITLRSGRSTIPIDASVSTPKPIADEIETETPGKVHPRVTPESTAQTSEPVRTYVSPIPYPCRLKKQKMEEQYGKFLELFKQLHINLPFLDALKEMPKYAKFLKEVLSNKKKLEELSCVTLNEECSAVLQNKLPKKMTDPGRFTIPCLIGSLSDSNALADLGASINLMPYSVFAKLDLGEPKPTRMSI
ncbi:uncharacterized protein LOC143572485 [Bidens hawaiensis]|uniref:uncharacterized protein LOC143572485 n=1 Tax=Bidens hawaiensis TaxID=980011 RepID=UPI0040496723